MISDYIDIGIRLVLSGSTLFVVFGMVYLTYKQIKNDREFSKRLKAHDEERFCEFHPDKKIYSFQDACSWCKNGDTLPYGPTSLVLQKIKDLTDAESIKIRGFLSTNTNYRKKVKDKYKFIEGHKECKVLKCFGCRYELLVQPLNDLWETKNILSELDEPIANVIINKFLDPEIQSKEAWAKQYLDKYNKAKK